MFRRVRRPEPDRIEVSIGRSATISGEIKCDASIRIDGVMEGGRIETLNNVIIGKDARVHADIKADVVSVAGAYKGELDARRVELLEGGRMWGAIRVQSFYLDEGAFMHGELIMPQADETEPPFSQEEAEEA